MKMTKQQKALLTDIVGGKSKFDTGYESRAGRSLEKAGLITVKRPAKTADDKSTWVVKATGEGKKALKA
jgi:hypothetical protein